MEFSIKKMCHAGNEKDKKRSKLKKYNYHMRKTFGEKENFKYLKLQEVDTNK